MINVKEALEMHHNVMLQATHTKSLSSNLAYESLVHLYFPHHSL